MLGGFGTGDEIINTNELTPIREKIWIIQVHFMTGISKHLREGGSWAAAVVEPP